MYNHEYSLLQPILMTLPSKIPSLLTKITEYEVNHLIGKEDSLYVNLLKYS